MLNIRSEGVQEFRHMHDTQSFNAHRFPFPTPPLGKGRSGGDSAIPQRSSFIAQR